MRGAGVAVVAAVDAAPIRIERPAKRHPLHPVESRLAGRRNVFHAVHVRRIDHMFLFRNAPNDELHPLAAALVGWSSEERTSVTRAGEFFDRAQSSPTYARFSSLRV